MAEIENGVISKDAIAANPHILSLPVSLTVSVGSARITIGELLALRQDSIITLNSKIEDPVEIVIGERIVAQGELIESDGEEIGIGVRITKLATSPEPAK
ncbi:MAG: hypothetical protein A3E78_00430 [Alphaproteobacteria bacterium RIFCSPHIGHO2_12_FULL_63_12]|nr:MAG: hypothetical protein A3E78_00430 [Alphaproteobacteria bacterium RIFCSPHIGHO2_12_FULL_63_12]